MTMKTILSAHTLVCLLFFAPHALGLPTEQSAPAAKRQNVCISGTCNGVNHFLYTSWTLTGLGSCTDFSSVLSAVGIATSPIKCTANNTQAEFTSPWGMATEIEDNLQVDCQYMVNPSCHVKL